MKLSMWMIANRLSSFDPELNIGEKAPAVLNSARLAYATNCVHVYAEKDYVVCNGEGNIIKIHNMDITQAFEIIQSVFDYFEDWSSQVRAAIREHDYQKAVDLAWRVFQNPMVLFDGNNKVLGITKQYPENALDKEWAYLHRYGYASLNAVKQMRFQYSNIPFSRHGSQSFHFSGNQLMKYPGITYCMYSNDIICGRISLLSRDRMLNEGDYQLLDVLADLLEPSLGQFSYKEGGDSNNVFYSLLFKQPYSEKQLDMQLGYLQWKLDDSYRLAMIQLTDTSLTEEGIQASLNILAQTASQYMHNCVVIVKKPYLLILANRSNTSDTVFSRFFQDVTVNNPVKAGLSHTCHNLRKAGSLYQQARAALFYGMMSDPDQLIYSFFNYAIDFIIDTPSIFDGVDACMPGIHDLWKMQHDSGDMMFSTLKCFLDNERSASRTAAALFTHRNTVLYRIQKIQDFLGCSLDDVYVRDYCKLSIRTIELYYKKNEECR